MKMLSLAVLSISLAFAAGPARAADNQDMKMKEMNAPDMSEMHGECMQMMQNMKGMESKDGMKGMPMDDKTSAKTHHATGTVKGLDKAKGTMTLAHGPVKSLDWPAMTMTFGVKDKMLLDKVSEGKKVDVDFIQEGSNYIIVKVK